MSDDALTLGARYVNGRTTFRVWAPERTRVDVVIEGQAKPASRYAGAGSNQPTGVSRPMIRDGEYWVAELDVEPGTTYRYRLDGDAGATFPDPASRYQPEGVHGPSQVVDPCRFQWSAGWRPPAADRLIFYELHVGTFTPQGTFAAAQQRLPYLRDLGVTAIEIMPVAEFPGRWNWGYDGVCLFAPTRAYGVPDDLRALVDAAHQHGLAVFLDVVYNHLGPDGAYANAFSPYYFTDRHCSPWGCGVNLDGPHSAGVRCFLIENAIHWAREYHIDGLRLDATHALVDDGPRHFLEELTTRVRRAAGAHVLFVAEDERDIRKRLRPAAGDGWGLDGVWEDHFHHEIRVHVAGDRDGYFAAYSGTTEAIAERIARGLRACIFCIQNHDQIGNRADGARLNHEVAPAVFRAVTTLLLLAPETPLLFMGQEWAASTPFLFFTDHHPELGARVTEGRRQEFRDFSAFRDPAAREQIPDPQTALTFQTSRLRWEELDQPCHAGVHRLCRRLLAIRGAMQDPAPFTAAALDDQTIAMSSSTRLVVVRLGGAGMVSQGRIAAARPELSTEDAEFAADPQPVTIDTRAGTIRFARPGAVVLRLGRPLAQ